MLELFSYTKLNEKNTVEQCIKSIKDAHNLRCKSVAESVLSICSDSLEDKLFIGTPTSIKVYELPKLQEIRSLNQKEATCLCYHEGLVYAGSKDHTISSWDTYKWKQLERKEAHTSTVLSLRVATCTGELVSSGGDSTIKFRSLIHLHPTRQIENLSCRVLQIDILSESNFLVGASEDNSVKVWNLQDLSLLIEFSNDSTLSVCSIDNKALVASGNAAGTVHIWNIYNKRNQQVLLGHKSSVLGLQTMRKMNRLFSISNESIILWDCKTFNKICKVKADAKMFHLTRNDSFLIAGNQDLMAMWDTYELRMVTVFRGPNCKIDGIAGDNVLYTKGSKNGIMQWDIASKTYFGRFKLQARVEKSVFNLRKKMFLFYLSNASIVVWNLDKHSEDFSYNCHADTVVFVDWFSDSEVLSIGNTGNLYIYDLFKKNVSSRGKFGCLKNIVLSPNKRLLIGSENTYVEIYHMKKRRSFKMFRCKQEVSCIAIEGKTLAIGGIYGIIEVWNISTDSKICDFPGHSLRISSLIIAENSDYLISGSYDESIKLWDIKSRYLFGTANLAGKIRSMYTSDFTTIYVGAGQSLLAISNPLTNESTTFLGPNWMSFGFAGYISQVSSTSEFNREMSEWVILPYGINLLHIACYYGNSDLAKQCLKSGCPYTKTSSGETPLSISISRRSVDCIGAIAKHVTKIDFSLEEDIIALNKASPSTLPLFYDRFFQVSSQPGLPGYGHLGESIVKLSSTTNIDPKGFLNEDSSADTKIQFWTSSFKMNFLMGSRESLEFLRSLIETDSKELFRTPFINFYMKYKWKTARILIWVKGGLHMVLMLALLFCLFTDYMKDFWVFTLLILNSSLCMFEIIKLMISIRRYSMWNVVDLIQIALIYFYVGRHFGVIHLEDSFYNLEMAGILMMVWTRGTSYFRVFSNTRYMIRMIVEVVKDMISFMVILCYATFGFAIVYSALTNSPLVEAIIHVYRLDYEDFDTDKYGTLTWIWFFLASLVNPLILLNMLIAVMGDTYDRVQENQDVTDLKEMADVILECESLLFWRKGHGKKEYFQAATEHLVVTNNHPSWEGRIIAIKRQVVGIRKHQLRMKSDMNTKIDKIHGALEKLIQSTGNI